MVLLAVLEIAELVGDGLVVLVMPEFVFTRGAPRDLKAEGVFKGHSL